VSAASILTTETAPKYLLSRGLIEHENDVIVSEMSGGLSSVVLSVESSTGDSGLRWVLKQSLPELKVAQLWVAKQERSLTEARALQLVRQWSPSNTPEVLDVDARNFVLLLSRAPDDLVQWKSQLLAGRIDPMVARTLGALLGEWHRLGRHNLPAVDELHDAESFEQLRIAPYYRNVASAVPEASAAINTLISDMLAHNDTLVHGDFSPKNILAGPSGVWVLDFEVAHRGDPNFDVAFLLVHLISKSINDKSTKNLFEQCATEFVSAYESASFEQSRPNDAPTLIRHVGALLLARVDGKSPLEYLDAAARDTARAWGLHFLLDASSTLNDFWHSAGAINPAKRVTL
jgi:tRNA A-37 threonylcarbamoyl transferase component Bud32